MDINNLKLRALEMRKEIVTLIFNSKAGHIGGALSSADIVTALFYHIMKFKPQDPEWDERDRFILSKGHCCEGYLCALANLGFFPKDELALFCKNGSKIIGHPNNEIPGIEMCTGSLGHGLSISAGMAITGKMDNKDYRVFCVMGDGEQDEGSNWEAAMFAGSYGLDNLYVYLDRNHLQISGPTEEVMKLEPLKDKYEAFGFYVEVIDGNNMQEILNAFERAEKVKNKPKIFICNTIKGKGVSYMEGNYTWHEGPPKTEEDFEIAIQDLDRAIEEVTKYE